MKPDATRSSDADDRLGRRELLQRGALAGLAMTGLRVSDISFGGSQLGSGEKDTVRHALDHGINYFDTADSYRGGDSETTIGEAVRGKRDRVYIASKTYTNSSDRRDSMMRSLEGSLQRLRTD